MSHESSHERRAPQWQIEREAKVFIDESDVSKWKERFELEGLKRFHNATVETEWFSVPSFRGRSVSARLRSLKEKNREKRFSWAVKVRISSSPEAKHIKESYELEDVEKDEVGAGKRLRKELKRLFGREMPKRLKVSRRLTKNRSSYETQDLGHPLHGVRFDLDKMTEINGKKIDPPIYILELEGLSETCILSAARYLGIDAQMLSSISGTALLKERGYLS